MTIQEFNETKWSGMSEVKYKDGKVYEVAAVDFGEQLIGLGSDAEDMNWVRCENCELTTK